MVLTLVTFLVSCGAKDKRKKFDKAADYNDYIIDIVDGVDEAWSTSIEEEDKDRKKQEGDQSKSMPNYDTNSMMRNASNIGSNFSMPSF